MDLRFQNEEYVEKTWCYESQCGEYGLCIGEDPNDPVAHANSAMSGCRCKAGFVRYFGELNK